MFILGVLHQPMFALVVQLPAVLLLLPGLNYRYLCPEELSSDLQKLQLETN